MQQLSAANTSPVNVYGKRLLTLNLNLRRIFRWPFLIASVFVPIIGADFLYHFNISPDLRNRKLIVASSSEAEHIQHLHLLFECLNQYGLSINPSKCTFGVPTLKFLGFQVCSTGIKPLEDRIEAILKFPQPTTITQLRHFLGMLNYYRRFIRQAAHILAPLVKFLKGIRNKKKKRKVKIKPEEVLEWTDEATTSFELVKQPLA
ncbi:transposon Tf2-6 polyprotein [Nephila pilipes]|uniref:Transposon Tf2-6 polyprotein n=1 Tax=Nephila pilipes TaxID=299642 RepID=A0A8X6PRP0_NEPPI|nr:transposon Tf2-6 polyprotein [Nephila pilipes]